MNGQLISEIPGAARLVFAISSTRDLERGTRAALVEVPRLFRLDVIVDGDTLRSVVRNLSRSQLRFGHAHHNDPGTNVSLGESDRFEPARATIAFVLTSENDAVLSTVTIGTIHLAELGLLRVTAQAIIRQVAVTPA